jgi:hypothetical protein
MVLAPDADVKYAVTIRITAVAMSPDEMMGIASLHPSYELERKGVATALWPSSQINENSTSLHNCERC